MGNTVGVKYAIRKKPRPAMRSFTHRAMTSARPMENGIVARANHRLLLTAFQNTGSSAITW